MSKKNSPLICAYKFEWIPRAHIYENWQFWQSFPYKWKSRKYNTRYIYDMNLTKLAQPQQATRWTYTIRVLQANIVHHILQTKSKFKSQISMQDHNMSVQCNRVRQQKRMISMWSPWAPPRSKHSKVHLPLWHQLPRRSIHRRWRRWWWVERLVRIELWRRHWSRKHWVEVVRKLGEGCAKSIKALL